MTAMIMTARHRTVYNAEQFAMFRRHTLPHLSGLLARHHTVEPAPGQLWARAAEQRPSGALEHVVAKLRERVSPDWELAPVRWHDPEHGDVVDDVASGIIRAGVRVR